MKAASLLAQHGDRLIVVVGPSGAGKDSVLDAWRTHLAAFKAVQDTPVHFARRTITRPAAAGGEAHEAASAAAFEQCCTEGGFAFWWSANSLSYGIRQRELQPLADGRWLVVNGSRAHLPALQELAPALRVVVITAPLDVLAERLSRRGREDASTVVSRLQRLAGQAPCPADLVLNNDGTVHDAMNRLHAWWQALAQREATHGHGRQACLRIVQ